MHSFCIDSCQNFIKFQFDLSQFSFFAHSRFIANNRKWEIGHLVTHRDESRGKSTLNACCYVIMQLKSNRWNNEFIIKQWPGQQWGEIFYQLCKKALKIYKNSNVKLHLINSLWIHYVYVPRLLFPVHIALRINFWTPKFSFQISIQHFSWMSFVHICRMSLNKIEAYAKIEAFAHYFSESAHRIYKWTILFIILAY